MQREQIVFKSRGNLSTKRIRQGSDNVPEQVICRRFYVGLDSFSVPFGDGGNPSPSGEARYGEMGEAHEPEFLNRVMR